jgi:hypothetical protein
VPAADAAVSISRVDAEHGNAAQGFRRRSGRPPLPSRAQIVPIYAARGRATTAIAWDRGTSEGGRLEIDVPTHGLVLIEVSR